MRVDVLAGVERRRRWSAAEKMRIVEETLQPDAKVMEVAQRNQVSRSLVFAWRRMAGMGQLDVGEVAEAGGYVVTCPALPGLVTEGDTLEEAKQMARDAIAAYLEGLRELGRPIPPGEEQSEESLREPVTVTLPAA